MTTAIILSARYPPKRSPGWTASISVSKKRVKKPAQLPISDSDFFPSVRLLFGIGRKGGEPSVLNRPANREMVEVLIFSVFQTENSCIGSSK